MTKLYMMLKLSFPNKTRVNADLTDLKAIITMRVCGVANAFPNNPTRTYVIHRFRYDVDRASDVPQESDI
jgi:hypothetical protein